MQTLKTAAIVVLLMTVMYGAYVSLTAPPEPLPVGVEEMLVISDEGSFAVDSGLPPGLGELDINEGKSVAGLEATDAGGAGSRGVPASGLIGANASLSNDPIALEALGDSGGGIAAAQAAESNAMVVEDLAAAEGGVTTRLSDVGPSAEPAGLATAIAPTSAPRSYPATNITFEMPDPHGVSSSFNASPDGVDLPETNLALTSGTSDSGSLGAPPTERGITQAAAVDDSRSEIGSDLGLANAIRTADAQYAEDQRKEALATLSIFYNMPQLSGEQRSELLSRLDPLARDVIYSRRHLLEQPHRVGQNETLMEIAARYEVPWQLLANINQINDPVTVLPGTELKVVRGPFRAEVDVTQKELTLFLGDLYAGRFPIGIGDDPTPNPGTFTVQDKQTSRTFYDASGSPVPPGSPNNPYGEVWIDLGGQLSIHGSPSTTSPSDKGCISLAADYADDLYGILSQGSSVTIRR